MTPRKPIRASRSRGARAAARAAAAESARIELNYAGREPLPKILKTSPQSRLEVAGHGVGAALGWSNRFIEGDNAEVLRLLRQDASVSGKVTLCYIDPPFATGQEFRTGLERTATISHSAGDRLAYADSLPPVVYLEFLRQRLILLHELLGPRGCIWVHIGQQMSHYVRVLLDEVFGRENFVNAITRVKCNPKNFSRRAFGNVTDTLLFYSKTGRHIWNDAREQMSEQDLARLFPRVDSQGRRYTTTPLHAPGETQRGDTGQPWRGMRPPAGRHWRYAPAELERLAIAGQIEWSATGNPRKIVFAEDVRRAGKKRQDIWMFKDPTYPSYPTEKNLELLRTIVETCSNPGDLVLDCFAGSGTTLAAAAQLGRRWIGIDASSVAVQASAARLASLPSPVEFRSEILRSA